MDGIENDGIIPKAKLTMKSRSLEAAINGASKKMETEIISLRTQLKGDKAKLESLTSKLHQLQQQTEIYTHECQVVREKIKDSNWAFTKETSQSLLKIKKPTPEILDLSEKFMMLIEQKETNWKMFQASVRNYDSLKALLDKFNPENIREENVDLILGLWKNYNAIQPKIAKTCRGASILLDWVTSCMEFKIKKATLESVKRSLSEVQNKIKDYNNNIAEKESLVVTLQEKLKELKENPPKEEPQKKKMPLQNITQSRANLYKENSDGEIQSKKTTKGKLNKLLSSQSVANMHSEAENKKAAAAAKIDENEQGSMQNASCEVKLETAQVNAIFSSTYRFHTNFGSGLSFRHDDMMSSSRKNSQVEKIFKIIGNHDDRNKDNAVLSDSKIFFVKERTVNNTPNPKSDGPYHEGHSIDIRQPLFEEDKTNSTYLNSLRNPILENSNPRKKVFSTIGTNSGASIGMNTLRQEELSHRTNVTKSVLTPRVIEDGIDLDINVLRRNKKNEEDSVKNEEEEIADDDQSFAACCKKGINRFFCA